MSLTQKKLERFVKMRNSSGLGSNLQFMADASACGFSVKDLGNATKHEDKTGYYYLWRTPFGELIERNGMMTLYPRKD
jgi:hypothetical protein